MSLSLLTMVQLSFLTGVDWDSSSGDGTYSSCNIRQVELPGQNRQ